MRNCKKTLKALAGGNFEAALEEFRRASCDSMTAPCQYRTEDPTECSRDCLLAYLNYLSLTVLDKEFNEIVTSYIAWYQANNLMDETAQKKTETDFPYLSEHREKVILVVEDDLRVLSITSRILMREGYEVIEAANGLSAGEILDEKSDVIDMVFSDVVMPRGMNGLELAEWVRGKYKHIRVLLTSGYSDVANRCSCKALRFKILNKPYRREQLLKAIEDAFIS